MVKLFSQRYNELLEKENSFLSVERNVVFKFIGILLTFNEGTLTQPDRFNSTYMGKKFALHSAVKEFIENNKLYNEDVNQMIDSLDEYPIFLLFDIAELLHIELTLEYKPQLEKEINELFSKNDNPWRILNGRFIKIDSSQFDQDLKNKAIIEFQKVANIEPNFMTAFSEFTESIRNLSEAKYNEATLYAAKSLESTLKIVSENNGGTVPKKTIENYMDCAYFPDLPKIMNQTGFCTNVLSSLFFIRNNSSAGHGTGDDNNGITVNMARLAVDLAATLNTFIINEYIKKKFSTFGITP